MNQPGPTRAFPVIRGFLHRRRIGLMAAAMLGLFWWLAVSASTHWSHTSDELPHITAGYAYDRFGDFRMQPENGNLPQRVHGLAPIALSARFPQDKVLWENSGFWQLGWDFFYSLDNPTDQIVLWARALSALFGVSLGCFVFLVARRWYGPAGGLFSLTLYILCPNFLFHSAQATSDVAAVLFLTLATWSWWSHLARRGFVSAVIAGLASGLALTAKFSGLLIVPIFAVLLLADAWLREAPGRRGRRGLGNVAQGIAVAAVAVTVIWALYGFRFSARGEGMPVLVQMSWPWRPELMFAGWKGILISQALSWHLLPEAFLRGLDYVLASEVERPAFLAGEISPHGWWQFFPTLFMAKTTAALLVGTGVAGFLGFNRVRQENWHNLRPVLERWLPLAAVAGVTWLAALHSTLNIGHRHILAVYPPLFVAAGGLARLPGRWVWLPVLLGLLQLGESVRIRPHYLAYFNVLAGGPSQGYRLAVDSSLDWGQGLPALRDWLAEHRRPDEPLYLSYFGSAWPPHYGVRPTHFLPGMNIARPPAWTSEYGPGLYCISATSLAQVYSRFQGPWRAEWNRELADLGLTPDRRAELRFSRLCRYLQRRPPDDNAGYAILIFRLGPAEIKAALDGPVGGG